MRNNWPSRAYRRRADGRSADGRSATLLGLSALVTALVVTLMATTILVLIPHLSVAADTDPQRALTPTTTPALIARADTVASISDVAFTDVDMVTANEGWAIGTSARTTAVATGSGIFEYSKGQWVRAFQLPMTWLTHLRMVTATEGWAGGWSYASASKLGVIAHIVNGQVALTYFAEPVEALDSLSAGNVWAACSSVFVHYDGQHWSTYAAPQPGRGRVLAISMLSASDGWAAGSNGALYHYAGGVWRRSGMPLGADLYGIKMLSATDGWAVGWNVATDGTAVVLHYDGAKWSRVDVGRHVEWLHTIAMLNPSDGWIVGGFTGARGSNLVLRYDGARWKPVPVPTQAELDGVSMVSPSEGWAVGLGVILHYHNGVWRLFDETTHTSALGAQINEGVRITPGSLVSPTIISSSSLRWSRRRLNGM
ncbi:MAG TPA: hypothetical protein VJN88_06315 [Ktedonobacterales bacterium]|nr:hypothetical protein [Ktedonobacterales bacterium]